MVDFMFPYYEGGRPGNNNSTVTELYMKEAKNQTMKDLS